MNGLTYPVSQVELGKIGKQDDFIGKIIQKVMRQSIRYGSPALNHSSYIVFLSYPS